jgi:hypothetical protein
MPQDELRAIWTCELRASRNDTPVHREPHLVHELEGVRVARVEELRANIDPVSASLEKLHPPSRTVRSFQYLDIVTTLAEPMGGG